MAAPSNLQTVVVGVDGSPQAQAALRWAAQYAHASRAALRAVTAWRYPTTYGVAPRLVGGALRSRRRRAAARLGVRGAG